MAKGKYHDWLTKDSLLLLESYARDGLNDEQIASKIGISRKTFYEWMNQHSDIRDAIKRGKAPVDVAVENALYKSAIGFTKTLKKPIKVRDKSGAEHIEYAEEEVYFPPMVAAACFWLKNRKPHRWKDKPEDNKASEQVKIIIDV